MVRDSNNTNRSASAPLGFGPCSFQHRHGLVDTNRAQYESLVRTSDAPVVFRSFPDPSRMPLGDRV